MCMPTKWFLKASDNLAAMVDSQPYKSPASFQYPFLMILTGFWYMLFMLEECNLGILQSQSWSINLRLFCFFNFFTKLSLALDEMNQFDQMRQFWREESWPVVLIPKTPNLVNNEPSYSPNLGAHALNGITVYIFLKICIFSFNLSMVNFFRSKIPLNDIKHTLCYTVHVLKKSMPWDFSHRGT